MKSGIIYGLSLEENKILVKIISLHNNLYTTCLYEGESARDFWLQLAILADCPKMREDLFALEKEKI